MVTMKKNVKLVLTK